MKELIFRTLSIIRGKEFPVTLDEDTRSVEVVGATENPTLIYDYERGYINEVLLMSGCEIPEIGQIPLLDTHMRYDTSTVIGSFRNLRIEGDKLLGRAYFSTTEEAEKPWIKLKEGHLTDFSIGYQVQESIYIPEGEKQTINGKTFFGPIKIATKWKPKELSICPIGADEQSKVRVELKNNKEDNKMEEKLRKFLENRGLSPNATEEEAIKFLETLSISKTDDKVIQDAIRAEQERVLEIRAICEKAGIQKEEIDKYIKENKNVEEVRKIVLDYVLNTTPTVGGAGYRPSVEILNDERDKFRKAAEDAILIRAGYKVEKISDGAIELAGLTLREIARESLRISNQPYKGDALQIIGRALTSSDLPVILGNVANKSLMIGYEEAEETWPIWCDTGTVTDFKIHTAARPSETDDLDEVKEDGEYKYDKISEESEQFKIATYGKIFRITRQAIINDDLGVITNIPKLHGQAAARKIGDIVYAVLTSNSNMGDGIPLFHANHNNLAATGGAPSISTIAVAVTAMKKQKDKLGKKRLNIRPRFFIAPVSLETVCEQIFRSQLIGTQSEPNQVNIYAGEYFTRAYDARLDDDSTSAWYIAGPKGMTVKVFFLNGVQTPYLETREGWTIDGVEMKVRIDAGAKAMDWRALYKNPGA